MKDVIFVTGLTSMALPLVLIFLNSSIAKKNMQEREKPSAFECGFDPTSTARLSFSLRFFLIAVIFLIFDVEITLIIPLPLTLWNSNITTLTLTSIIFIFILILGLFHEWSQGALDWK